MNISSKFFRYFAILHLFIWPFCSQSQQINLDSLAEQLLESNYANIVFHANNNNNDVLATIEHGASTSELFVIKNADSSARLIKIGQFADVEPVAFLDNGDILFNSGKVKENETIAFLSTVNDGQYVTNTLIDRKTKVQATGLNTKFVSYNVYDSDGNSKGYVMSRSGHSVKLKGFPLSKKSMQLQSKVLCMNNGFSIAGTSQGYDSGALKDKILTFFENMDTSLLLMSGVEAIPMYLNEANQICGIWKHPVYKTWHAFYWDKNKIDNGRDGWEDIMPGKYIIPTAINDSGVVVGKGLKKPFVWLDDRLIEDSIFNNYLSFLSINNRNWVIAEREKEDKIISYLLNISSYVE